MAKKKRRYKKKKKATSNLDIAVITLIVLSILLAVLIYTKSGVIGAKLNEIFGGVLGIMQYVLPIGTFAVAIKLASEGREGIAPKLIQYGIAIISLSIVFSVFQISSGELQSSKELSELVKDAYYFGSQGKGGGAVGAVAAVPLAKLLGDVGAVIFCIGTAVILLVFTFGINLSDIINLMLDRIEEKKEERFERREQLAKESKKEEQEETPGQRRKRLREERKIKSQLEKIDEKAPMDNQIKINFGGRIVDGTDEKKGLKKYDHTGENLEPLTKQSKKQKQISQQLEPDVIDANLFKDVEEQKEEKKKAVLQLEHAQIVEDEHYEYPPVELLSKPSKKTLKGGAKALTDTATRLQKTLYSFGVSAKVENVSVGPAITRYELKPELGVKVSKIVSLADDIKLSLAAADIRIEAPIPGKSAIGIEVPNKEAGSVYLRELIENEAFKNNQSMIAFAAGKDIAGKTIVADIAKMPHLLIAGATGSGKSVCINTIIMSILYKARPDEVKMIMVDPKVVELSTYNGIPHLLLPVVTDPKKAAGALNWAVNEMTKRYKLFADMGVRNLKGYNDAVGKMDVKEGEAPVEKLPQIVIIVDELADLMMVAPGEVEDAICRLAQLARAAGLHLVLATQRPSVNVITGLIKANMPSRIAFSVSSGVDSRTIIDMNGAEKLLGKGDMLFYPAGYQKPVRVQGAFVSDKEVQAVVDFLKENSGGAAYSEEIQKQVNSNQNVSAGGATSEDDKDVYFVDAGKFIIEKDKASIGMLQRVFKIGFNRAARIMDQLAEAGVVGEEEGTKPRKVLMSMEQFEQYIEESV